jgi:hypothetical protein
VASYYEKWAGNPIYYISAIVTFYENRNLVVSGHFALLHIRRVVVCIFAAGQCSADGKAILKLVKSRETNILTVRLKVLKVGLYFFRRKIKVIK